MALSSVNNMISLQESQLIHMLEQGPARARVEDNAENRRAWMAAGGQNLPVRTEVPGTNDRSIAQAAVAPETWEPLDPAFNPENINALLLAMQTQQASLDTTLLVGNSSTGPGGRSLIDYLTAPENALDADNDDTAALDAMP